MKKNKRALAKRKRIHPYNETAKLWRAYHERWIGRPPSYDEQGSLYGAIVKAKPNYQTEILVKMFARGYELGRRGYRLIPNI